MRRNPVEVAKDILKQRFPEAVVAFIAGSSNRGEATASSDIDIVVIFEKLEFAWRESFIFDEWPVEAFVHDPETLNYFFQEVDAKSGIPSLPFMVVEGKAIPEYHEMIFKLKSLAEQVLAKKPPEWSNETIYHQRYGISDLVDDLKAPRNEFESHIIIGALQEALGNFYFRTNRMWSASRKHIPRRLEKVDPKLFSKWVKVIDAAYSGKRDGIIALAEEILRPYGGLLFDGYKRDAPRSWRLPIQDKCDFAEVALLDVNLHSEEKNLIHPKLGELLFRSVKISDAPKVRRLLNDAYKRLLDLGLNYNATFQDDELTIEGFKDGGSVLVVECNSEIIGTMRIKEFNQIDNRKCLFVSRFAVRPDLQKSGLGSILLKLAEKIARRESYECMQLDTAQPAKHLIEYYQSQGFEIIKPIYFDGKTYTSWVLEKTL